MMDQRIAIEAAQQSANANALLVALAAVIKRYYGCGDPSCDICETCNIARDIADHSSLIRQETLAELVRVRSARPASSITGLGGPGWVLPERKNEL